MISIALSILIFLCNKTVAYGNEETETVYYYIVQPGDHLWKISNELYGDGSLWSLLYNSNHQIADPSLIFPGMMLEIPYFIYPEHADERFMTWTRKSMNSHWLFEEYGYVHFSGKSNEFPENTAAEALQALRDGNAEIWLGDLNTPRILTEQEKEHYRKMDSRNILYSYEIERGLPDDRWYSLAGYKGCKWLVIENLERGSDQEFYCFRIKSIPEKNTEIEKIIYCEQIHGAGGKLYLALDDGITVWVMTKEINGRIVGIAGDFRGTIYIGGNFYYEKQQNGTIEEFYQSYSTHGTATDNAEGATGFYPY